LRDLFSGGLFGWLTLRVFDGLDEIRYSFTCPAVIIAKVNYREMASNLAAFGTLNLYGVVPAEFTPKRTGVFNVAVSA
jgi:hypothetical protein